MKMADEHSTLTNQWLAFSQTLADKGQAFSFKLTLGNTFSFSLDTRGKIPAPEVRKKKVSPSTQKRNLLRRQKFLESKNFSPASIHSDDSTSESTSTLKYCEFCGFVAKSDASTPFCEKYKKPPAKVRHPIHGIGTFRKIDSMSVATVSMISQILRP